ncbi:hypothetical protein BV22DRAFT_75777 [Leucogyrophana mollusca]|uniref:Uncharacterized protein n=1 Tax=Leucogyrophana mollusca TaxID=85980 RepID=A0ACB8C063_9AGAM|nr:hypothetical protein BV22DRAFT_75777 [Leucogyrophana mollusca]
MWVDVKRADYIPRGLLQSLYDTDGSDIFFIPLSHTLVTSMIPSITAIITLFVAASVPVAEATGWSFEGFSGTHGDGKKYYKSGQLANGDHQCYDFTSDVKDNLQSFKFTASPASYELVLYDISCSDVKKKKKNQSAGFPGDTTIVDTSPEYGNNWKSYEVDRIDPPN